MKKINIEKIFAIIALLFGCFFIFIIPPFQSPDEDSHFKKAYVISKGELYAHSNKTIIGLNIPDSMQDYISVKLTMMGKIDNKYSFSDYYYDQLLPGDYSQVTLREVSTSGTTPIAHLIPAIGVLVSKIASAILLGGTPSVPFMLLFARFACLISYIIMGYFAIKITPVFKKSMLAILLNPMSLFLASMVSYDNLLLSITLLSVASIFKLTYDKNTKFNRNLFILFTILGYILLNVKVIYVPILLLLLLIPKDKFKDNKKNSTLIKLGILIMIITILLKIPNWLLTSATTENLSGKQLSFILNHPFNYTKILFNNFFNQLSTQLYWMIGTFGLIDTYLPPLFIFISLLNLLLTFITDGIFEKIKINKYQKLISFLSIIMGLAGMYTAMYIYWTPQVLGITGGSEITGVQGRYFIPLLINIPIIMSNNLLKKQKKITTFAGNYLNYSIILIITCLSISIFTCLVRFWI